MEAGANGGGEPTILEVDWEPRRTGYENLCKAVNRRRVDHDGASLRALFGKYGAVGRIRMNRYGDRATVAFADESSARFACFAAQKKGAAPGLGKAP